MRPQFNFAYTLIKKGILPLGWVSAKNIFSTDPMSYHQRVLGESLANVLAHAGPVWTKLGQILSSRDDLFPKTVCRKLEVLYKDQPPMAKSEVRELLKKSYGNRRVFKKINWNPIGVGSVGQVHSARLEDDTAVVFKILRPNVQKRLTDDLAVLRWLLSQSHHFGISADARFFATNLIGDLEKSFLTETDLQNELNSLQRFGKRYKKSQRFYIPKVFPEISNSFVLVMEEIKGLAFSELKRKKSVVDKQRREVAERVLREVLVQVLDDGDFHADPHAGNLYLMEDGRVAFIDLGLTGRFDPTDRLRLSKAVKAFLDRDSKRVIESLLEFGELAESFDMDEFKKEISMIVKENREGVKNYALGKEGIPLDRFVEKLFRAARKHGIFLPSDTTLLIKTLITVEGVARGLNPELNLLKTTVPVVISSLVPKWMRNPFRSR